MTPVDDLKVGMYIAVVAYKGEEEQEYLDPFTPRRTRAAFNGEPYRIIGISLPFIATENMQLVRASLDVRTFDVQKLDEKYVMALTGPRGGKPFFEKPVKKEKPDKHQCPHCEERIRSIWVVGTDRWTLGCNNCGWREPDHPVA